MLVSPLRFGMLGSPGTGKGVSIYVVDSGVMLDHQEFESWLGGSSRASYGCAPPPLGPPGVRIGRGGRL